MRADFGEHGKDGKGLRMRELRATHSEVSDAYVRRHAAGGQSGTREDRAGQGHKNTMLRAVGPGAEWYRVSCDDGGFFRMRFSDFVDQPRRDFGPSSQ